MCVTSSTRLTVQRPRLPASDSLQDYLQRIDASRVYSNSGPLVREMERRLGEHFGIDSSQVVVIANATDAIEAAVAEAPCSPGSLWELPSWTFTATAGAAVRGASRIRFVDVDESGRLLPTPEAAGVVDVLPFGSPFSLDDRSEGAECLLIDAAASFDALRNVVLPDSKPVGVVVSLHATKTLSSGEGGVFFSPDGAWVERVRRWINHGMAGSRISHVPARNAKLSEFSAAVGLASLDAWTTSRDGWLAQQSRAMELTANAELVWWPHESIGWATPYWNVRCASVTERDLLAMIMATHEIETRRWWEGGCHSMPAYAHIDRLNLPMTTSLADTTLGLPLHIDMSEEGWDRIAKALGDFGLRRH